MTNQWDRYAEIFNKGVGTGGDALHTRLIHPVIDRYVGNVTDKDIVDLGCGNGYLERMYAPVAKAVVAVDYSEELLRTARNNTSEFGNISLIHADLMEALPLPPASADIVIANMVLQYLPGLEPLSSEVKRILKPQGIFIVVIDHPAHALFVRAQELAGKKQDKFIDIDSYFATGKRRKNSLWHKAVLTYYHRTIADYLNAISPFFRLDRMDELTEDGEMPRIAAFRWQKV